jgi:CRP-like cAMP-binding protein
METMTIVQDLIEQHPFLVGLNPRYMHFFTECALFQHYETGQEIFRENGEANRFYLIHTGRVDLQTFVPGRGMATIQVLGPGDALGWSWLFPPHEWQFTAVAGEPTELIIFDAASLREKTEENRDFLIDLVTRMARMLVGRVQGMRAQLVDIYQMRP